MERTGDLASGLDPVSAEWIASLTADSAGEREQGQGRLHGMLVQVARRELARRRASTPWLAGADLDDLAFECAGDAMLALLRKLDGFRGESRFTTWAYKFVILEVSAKLGRHYRRLHRSLAFDEPSWERLPDRLGVDSPSEEVELADLVRAVRRAVDETLTAHQRRLFITVVLEAVPLDAVVEELGTNRNAVYKTIFDARRKIRSYLVASGHLAQEEEGAGRR